MTSKIFKTRVLTDSQQSYRVMDVSGYSHFGKYGKTYQGSNSLETREVFFTGHTNKAKLQAEVKEALGSAYWPNLNIVEVI